MSGSRAVAVACSVWIVAATGVQSHESKSTTELQVWQVQRVSNKPAVLAIGETPTHVDVTVGQRLEVRLPAMLGAGLSWTVTAAIPSFLRLIEQRTERVSPRQQDGGPELQVFSFEAIGAGEGQLAFAYGRPWLSNETPRMRVVHTVTARTS